MLVLGWINIGYYQNNQELSSSEPVFFFKKHLSFRVFFFNPNQMTAYQIETILHNQYDYEQNQYCFYRYDLSINVTNTIEDCKPINMAQKRM